MKKKKSSSNKVKSINEIASKINLRKKHIEPYGNFCAKLKFSALNKFKDKEDSKLILVVNTIPLLSNKNSCCLFFEMLMQAFGLLRKKTILCVPTFTLENIMLKESYLNLFSLEDILPKLSDLNSIAYAHNLISSYINNSIIFNNNLNINPYSISWNKVSNVIDESLKNVITGVNNTKPNRLIKEEKIDYVLNSELTSILSLSTNLDNLKKRIGNIIIGMSKENLPVTISALKMEELITLLLEDSLKPTLIQTRQGEPVFLYISPGSDVLPGGNVLAVKTALNLAEYVFVKLDYNVNLSLEKFLNITCREYKIKPDLVIITTFINELNAYGGVSEDKLFEKNLIHLEKGVQFLIKDIDVAKKFGIPILINTCENRDITNDEIKVIDKHCSDAGVKVVFAETKNYNLKTGLEIAKSILETIRIQKSYYKPLYNLNLNIKDKIKVIAEEVYNINKINYSLKAETHINNIEKDGFGNLPVSIARVPYFKKNVISVDLNVKDVILYAGAGVVVVETMNSEFMPSFEKKYRFPLV